MGRSLRIPEGALTRDDGPDNMPIIPQGWTVTENTELAFFGNGVTAGGSIALRSPNGGGWRLSIAPLEGTIGVELED